MTAVGTETNLFFKKAPNPLNSASNDNDDDDDNHSNDSETPDSRKSPPTSHTSLPDIPTASNPLATSVAPSSTSTLSDPVVPSVSNKRKLDLRTSNSAIAASKKQKIGSLWNTFGIVSAEEAKRQKAERRRHDAGESEIKAAQRRREAEALKERKRANDRERQRKHRLKKKRERIAAGELHWNGKKIVSLFP